jgi:hypothetical protein
LESSGDVAVKPLELGAHIRWRAVSIEEFLTKETMAEFNIWPGDDTFLIGRLVVQSGKQKNTPVVRFGNLSMLADPDELIDMSPYGEHEAFLVECRSVSGFSGSPVFLTTTQTYLPKDGRPPEQWQYSSGPVISVNKINHEIADTGETGRVRHLWIEGTFGPWFIGIDRGHVPLYQPAYGLQNGKIDFDSDTEFRVDHNTGIACVIPAWKIVDILNTEALVKQRKRDDEEIACKKHVP